LTVVAAAGADTALDLAAAAIDDSNPWLGLASFTEEARAYFFGREEEVAELARRVQRKLLTVLFGQSGLGKTSILRAGLVPRLRAQGYCPIYVRIEYGHDAAEPSEQIKQAISRSAGQAGHWTQAGVAVAGESLWEFLHHRDDVLRDASGATLIPLLIFDQFEEIFTLAQSDEFGRARAARFIDELADLVENRPPQALEARLDEDEVGAQQFDFSRSDYRVLITLREDYLAPLESLNKTMPSLSQNRLRLAPMSGAQALQAVTQPGKRLVTEEVATAIVRFVAGGAELANAEVEPSLLSLICRELNDVRIAQGREEISLDLLAGTHATILSNFYERSLADQPGVVRRFIEDELVTDSGFRENIAEERVLRSFAAAGNGRETLARLVNRRLLRIEERLDKRRVELTHDVLCGVVKESRDRRHEREAREASERMLAEQRARELAARRALVRARQVATGCVLLALGAVIAAGIAYMSTQRAQRAEVMDEQARNGAEQLLGYLTDDFVRELESFGRLNVVAEFAKRQIDYFHGLPLALKRPETARYGALAMVHYARAKRTLGDLNIAGTYAAEAVQSLEQQRASGDDSEATAIALALAYATQAQILDNKYDSNGPVVGRRAAELLRPLAEAPQASIAARRAYVEVLVRVGYEQLGGLKNEEAIGTEQKAIRFATDLGARNLTNLDMGALYAEAGACLVPALINVGRSDEARRAGNDAMALVNKVLEQRPDYRLALRARQAIAGALSTVAENDLNPREALQYGLRTEQLSFILLKLDPENIITNYNLGMAYQSLGDALWAAGEVRAAIPYYLRSLDDYGYATGGGAGFVIIRAYGAAVTAARQAQVGDASGAAATIAAGLPFLAKLRQSEPQGSLAPVLVDALGKIPVAAAALERDDLLTARRVATDAVDELLGTVDTPEEVLASQKYVSLFVAANIAGHAEYRLGDYPAAERSERVAMAGRRAWGSQAVTDRRDLGEISTWLAMALVRQGKRAEAAQLIAPVVKFQRQLAARNRGDEWLPIELASALYVQALADQRARAALLLEAAALLDGTRESLRNLHDVRQWRERISAAQATD
jgi:AAA+ ATPase superfamily predicted ATPase